MSININSLNSDTGPSKINNSPAVSALQHPIVALPAKIFPFLNSLNTISECIQRIEDCYYEMDGERERLKMELRQGPPNLKVPVFWLETRPEIPIKAAIELFTEKRKELINKVPEQWRRDLNNQAEEQLYDFEMNAAQMFRKPLEQIELHKNEITEKLKFSALKEEIDHLNSLIFDKVIYCINFEEENQILIQNLPDLDRSRILDSFNNYVVNHDLYQRTQKIIKKLHSINSDFSEYKKELKLQSTRVKKLKKIDRLCDEIEARFKRASAEENICDLEEFLRTDFSEISSANTLVAEMDAQDAHLKQLIRRCKSGLKYIDSIDMNTFFRIHSINNLYSAAVDQADENGF